MGVCRYYQMLRGGGKLPHGMPTLKLGVWSRGAKGACVRQKLAENRHNMLRDMGLGVSFSGRLRWELTGDSNFGQFAVNFWQN